jgi:predicted extracellular nuclease
MNHWLWDGLAIRVLCLSTLLCSAPSLASDSTEIFRLEFIGEARLPSLLEVEDTIVGGLSGIVWSPATDEFYSVSDDPGNHGPARFYRLKIDLVDGRLERDGVEVTGVSPLRDRSGSPYDKDLVDPEGIDWIAGEGLFISSEGQIQKGAPPFIRQFDPDGMYVRDFEIPERYLSLEDDTRGLRHNLGFESLTVTPDGRYLITATEKALVQDGPEAAVDKPGPARILIFERATGQVSSEFLYWTEPVAARSPIAGENKSAGLVDLLALDARTLISVERSYSRDVGNTIRMYLVDLQDAEDLVNQAPGEGRRMASMAPASKSLILDLADLEIDLDNIDGIGSGPRLDDGRGTLILVGDDNFNPLEQQTQILAFAVSNNRLRVADIQGAAHSSPFNGQWVRGVEARVTATATDADFWIASERSDGDSSTSEGLRVLGSKEFPPVSEGARVHLSGRVVELGRPGRLSVTALQLSGLEVENVPPSIPGAERLGEPSRRIPTEVIDNDSLRHFEPEYDGIDFWESLESMKVSLRNPVVVGPSTRYGDLVVVADGGRGTSLRTTQGGLLLRPGDYNPERITVSFDTTTGRPEANVGDRFDGDIVGIVDYDHGVYSIRVLEAPPLLPSKVDFEPTKLNPKRSDLTLATFNVFNLGPRSETSRVDSLGRVVVNHLRSPDILALQEVQDDSGPEDDGVVSADQTLERLIASIRLAGGPAYDYRQVDPMDGQEGGYSGANIRVVLLFNPKRVKAIDRGDADPSGAAAVRLEHGDVAIEPSPGRVAPSHPAFHGIDGRYGGSRRPLVSEFMFRGKSLFVINCHLNSKRADSGLFGREQPPRFISEDQRSQQARVVRDFVSEILSLDSAAAVAVLGDFNDHEFRAPLRVLTGGSLSNLVGRVPLAERYTYNYRGNSQVLDHILVSPWLAARAEIDIVHGNSDLANSRASSDHDPVVARFAFRRKR